MHATASEMTTVKERKTLRPTSLAKIMAELLSPAEHFARLRANAPDMEASAWEEIRSWHEPDPAEIDCGFADPDEVREMVEAICEDYGVAPVAETLQLWLYLKHRQRFLTHAHTLYEFDGRFHICRPCDDRPYEVVTGYSYCGCPGNEGDIVDFAKLNPEAIPWNADFPTEVFWRLLDLDCDMPMGMLSYDVAIEPIDSMLDTLLKCPSGRTSPLPVLDNLASWAQKIEAQPSNRFNYIALIVHARLLQGLPRD